MKGILTKAIVFYEQLEEENRNDSMDFETRILLQDTNKYGTCVMNTVICKQTKTVIWMLSNGSSISENTIKTTSCENMMKTKGKIMRILTLLCSLVVLKNETNHIQ